MCSSAALLDRDSVDQRGRGAGVAVDVERVAVDADLQEQSLQERDAEPGEVFRLEREVELAARLGGAGERLEAGAQEVDAGADGGVELWVALLLADQVREDAGALLDAAELELLVALDHLEERLRGAAQPALG